MSVIKSISIIPPGLRPATGTLQNAIEFQNSKIEPQQSTDLEGCIYKSSGKRLVGLTTDNMLYTGQIEDDESYNNFILVHNKRKGKIRLVQVDHCIASPKIMNKNFSSSPIISKTESSLSDLHKEFGSKATKRLTEQRERLTMNIDAVKDQLERTVSGIKGKVIHKQTREVIHNVYKFMKDEARNGTKIPLTNYRERVLAATGISKCTYSKITSKEFINGVLMEAVIPTQKIGKDIKVTDSAMDQSVNENTSIYRPKINREASTRDDVYNLEDLVATHILSTLEPEAINIINNGDVSQFGGFVASNMSAILTSDSSQEMKIKKLTIFLYIQYLINFINTPMKNVTKKFVVCDKSAEVNNHILDTFSVNSPSGRTRPIHMRDKSLCFILILTAKAMDYEVDLTNLTKDCKIGVKKALEISRILAFNSSSKNKNVVTLKLPLPAPVSVTPKKRK